MGPRVCRRGLLFNKAPTVPTSIKNSLFQDDDDDDDEEEEEDDEQEEEERGGEKGATAIDERAPVIPNFQPSPRAPNPLQQTLDLGVLTR